MRNVKSYNLSKFMAFMLSLALVLMLCNVTTLTVHANTDYTASVYTNVTTPLDDFNNGIHSIGMGNGSQWMDYYNKVYGTNATTAYGVSTNSDGNYLFLTANINTVPTAFNCNMSDVKGWGVIVSDIDGNWGMFEVGGYSPEASNGGKYSCILDMTSFITKSSIWDVTKSDFNGFNANGTYGFQLFLWKGANHLDASTIPSQSSDAQALTTSPIIKIGKPVTVNLNDNIVTGVEPNFSSEGLENVAFVTDNLFIGTGNYENWAKFCNRIRGNYQAMPSDADGTSNKNYIYIATLIPTTKITDNSNVFGVKFKILDRYGIVTSGIISEYPTTTIDNTEYYVASLMFPSTYFYSNDNTWSIAWDCHKGDAFTTNDTNFVVQPVVMSDINTESTAIYLNNKVAISISPFDGEPTTNNGITNHLHTATETFEAKAPTCLEDGNIAYKYCATCDEYYVPFSADVNYGNIVDIKDVTISALEHSLTHHNAVPPTCTATGNSEYWECSNCHTLFSDENGNNIISSIPTIAKTAHTLVQHTAVPVTCTANGSIAYWECSACGKYFNNEQAETELTNSDITIVTTGHNLTHHDAVAPTYDENGNIEYWQCSNCNKYFTDANGENEVENVIVSQLAKTDINSNSVEISAIKNVYVYTGEAITPTISITNVNTNTTLTKDTDFTVSYENNIYTGEATVTITGIGAYTGTVTLHFNIVTLTSIEAFEPTCIEDGNIAYWTCMLGDNTLYFSDNNADTEITLADTVRPATGQHTLTKTNAVNATCLANGNIDYWTCGVCHKIFSDANGTTEITLNDTVVPKTQHTLTEVEAHDPTCTENGNTAYWTCDSCHNVFSDANGENEISIYDTVVTKTGHNLTEVKATTPTCTENGNVNYWHCDKCNKNFANSDGTNEISNIVSTATGHNLILTQAKPATCTEVGNSAYYTCSNCNKYFSDANGENEITLDSTVIPITSHNLTQINQKVATCSEDGNIEYYTCSGCNKIFSDANGTIEITLADTVIPKINHTLVATGAKEATCSENGNIAYWQCSSCHKYFSDANCTNEITLDDTVTIGQHQLVKTDRVEPTCTTNGNIEYYTCSKCHKHFSDANATTEITLNSTNINKSGHHLVFYPETQSTCTTKGHYAYYQCSNCDKYFADSQGKTEIADISTKNKTIFGSHDYELVPAIPATCTEDGTIAYKKCKDCNHMINLKGAEITENDIVVKAKGHTAKFIGRVNPTLTTTGMKEHYECTACNMWFADKDCTNPVSSEDLVIAKLIKLSTNTTVSGINSAYAYTGAYIRPTVTLKNKSTNKKLKLNTDYTVIYKNNKNTGTATVTINGIGIYGGTITQKFKIVKPTLKYRAYTQTNAWDKAWQVSPISTAINTKVAGVKINKRLQAIQMSLSGVEGSVQYRLYRQKDGWSAWGDSSKKTVIGGKADAKRTEAIQIKLTGQIKTLYDVYYRAYTDKGWTGWAKNGAKCGIKSSVLSTGAKIRGYQVQLVPKNTNFNVGTKSAYIDK